MILQSLSLQNFRNYTKAQFSFASGTTILVGPNTAGKTNLLDSIHLLSTGKSFLSDKEEELVRFGEEFGRIKGTVVEMTNDQLQMTNDEEETVLEILLTVDSAMQKAGKRYFVNGVARRRTDFALPYVPTLLFTPLHLSIINGSPNQRRNFLDEVLEQVDREYARSMNMYVKALRQRNALLETAKESGYRNDKQFQYWDELLITTGTYIHDQRQIFIDFMNAQPQHIFPIHTIYDHSVISEERLEKYKDAEMGACVTLVGPHRDDIQIELRIMNQELRDAKVFASRGQQRLIVLQLKLLQLKYMQNNLDATPLLLLDDIFSELDSSHIQLVSEMAGGSRSQQTIITTTHEEFIQGKFKEKAKVIELKGNY